MDAEINKEELTGAIASGAAVLQGCGTLLSAAEEMSPGKLSAGSGTGCMSVRAVRSGYLVRCSQRSGTAGPSHERGQAVSWTFPATVSCL